MRCFAWSGGRFLRIRSREESNRAAQGLLVRRMCGLDDESAREPHRSLIRLPLDGRSRRPLPGVAQFRGADQLAPMLWAGTDVIAAGALLGFFDPVDLVP